MDRERFEFLLSAYGADFARWPANERAAGAAFAAQHAVDAAAPIAEARTLDASLAPARGEAGDLSELAARILAAAPKPVRQVFDRRAAFALAACAVFGVVLGYSGGQFAPAPQDDDLFAAAFEAPMTFMPGDDG